LCIFIENKRFDCNTFLPGRADRRQASDVVFADDDGCVFVRSEKCRGVTCNRPEIWGRERQQARAIKAGRALRAQLDFACYLQKRTADPSHTFRDHLRNLGRHRRNRFLLIFYPFRSSRRFLLQSAVLRPLTVPFRWR